jgi:hypothetical protein
VGGPPWVCRAAEIGKRELTKWAAWRAVAVAVRTRMAPLASFRGAAKWRARNPQSQSLSMDDSLVALRTGMTPRLRASQ